MQRGRYCVIHTENANSENAFDLVPSKDLIVSLDTARMPTLSAVVNTAVEKTGVNTSASMSKEDFATANGISKPVLEKWIATGVVLLTPAPTNTAKRTIEYKKDRETTATFARKI